MKKDTIKFLNKLNESEKPAKIKITKNNMKEIPVPKENIKATPSIEREMKNKKKLKEESYNDDIYRRIEEALQNAGFTVDRYTDAGVLTYNLGWVVYDSSGEVNLTCDGTWLDDEEDDEDLEECDKSLKESLVPVSELPDFCYGVLPSDCSIIIIKKGENGYYLTNKGYEREYEDIEDWNERNDKADELCNKLNAAIDVTPEQRQSMEARSMFGNWND